MLKRLEVFLIAAVFILITAIILIIYSKQREQEFTEHSLTIQKTVLSGAAYAINLQLLEKQRHVHLFADEYSQLIARLSHNGPTDEKVQNDIKIRLQQRFPDFFTYTITDKKGVPKLLNIESLIGHACKLDLNNYSKRINRNNKQLQNKVYIHPQPFNYHYDVMAPLYSNGTSPRIFFISFYLKEIIDILKTHEVPGQSLILVRQSDPSLIEVTRDGVRNKLKRDIHLSNEEQRLIKIYENIPGTDWRLVDLPDPTYKEKYLKGLWLEAITILVIVTLALIILIFTLTRTANKRD